MSGRDLAADICTVHLRLSPRLQLNHPKRVAASGQSLTVRGNVRPRAATEINRAVLQYQQGPSGGWRRIANGTVGGDGSFAINDKAPKGHNLKARVYVPAQDGWVAAAKGFPLAVSQSRGRT